MIHPWRDLLPGPHPPEEVTAVIEIPKGSKNKALAEDFIAFSLRPENQKIHTTKLGYGSTNLHTAGLLDPALAAQLNTAPDNLAQAIPMDSEFWVNNGEDLEQRFNAWVAKTK